MLLLVQPAPPRELVPECTIALGYQVIHTREQMKSTKLIGEAGAQELPVPHSVLQSRLPFSNLLFHRVDQHFLVTKA